MKARAVMAVRFCESVNGCVLLLLSDIVQPRPKGRTQTCGNNVSAWPSIHAVGIVMHACMLNHCARDGCVRAQLDILVIVMINLKVTAVKGLSDKIACTCRESPRNSSNALAYPQDEASHNSRPARKQEGTVISVGNMHTCIDSLLALIERQMQAGPQVGLFSYRGARLPITEHAKQQDSAAGCCQLSRGARVLAKGGGWHCHR